MECSRKTDESIRHVVNEASEEVAKAYKRVAGSIMGNLLTEVLAPIWIEHEELAPEWYRQSRSAKPSRPKIKKELRERLLATLDEVELSVKSTIPIAENACDEKSAARYQEGIDDIVDYIVIARSYVETLEQEP